MNSFVMQSMPGGSVRRRRALRLLGFAILCAACGLPPDAPSPETLELSHDLVLELPRAEVHRELHGIDFGEEGSRGPLVTGWSWNERSAETGVSFVWSEGDASSLDLFLVEPRQVRVEFVARPYPFPDGSPQAVEPRVSGRSLAEIELTAGFHRYAFDLPAQFLEPGWNRLTFAYRYLASPRELGQGADDRRLAVAWDRLQIRPATYVRMEDARSRIAPGPSLRVPFGTGIAWYVELPDEAWLTVGRRRIEGDTPGRLEVHAAIDGAVRQGKRESLARLEAAHEPRVVPIPGNGARLVRLAVHSVAEDPTRPASGAFVVERPEIRLSGAIQKPTAKEWVRDAEGRRSAPEAPRRPLVLIYLVDTLRADRVGVYGAERPLTPEIDAFAAEATLFERAVAQAPWTRPASASVLTGLTPLGHGVQTLDDRLTDEAVTLQEILQEAGYRTAAFSTNGHVTPRTGFGQGFEDFYFFTWNPPSSEVTEGVTQWLDEIEKEGEDRPLFLYVHTLDPHAPYQPPEDLRERFAPAVDDPRAGTHDYMVRTFGAKGEERRRMVSALAPLYDAEVAANDRSFGALLNVLRDRGLYDGALIVFVSDHGEELDEHGFLGHGNNLHGESLNVPLIVKWPGQATGARVAPRVQHVDLMPTILAHLGLESPAGMDLPGLDLALVRDAEPGSVPERSAVSHLDYEERRAVSVLRGDWKLIEPRSPRAGRHPHLYRVTVDPAERRDLHEERPVRAGWLASLLRAVEQASPGLAAEEAELDEETRKSLEALGYF